MFLGGMDVFGENTACQTLPGEASWKIQLFKGFLE
jgi:hypothetical protein